MAVTFMVLFLQATPLSKDPWWQQSTLQPHFSKMADWVKARMPEDIGEYFSFMQDDTLKQALQPGLTTPDAQPDQQPKQTTQPDKQ